MGSNGLRLFYVSNAGDEKPSHDFLDTCSFCYKRLRPDRDIFMYRGDTPFCSEECRQERITMDETAAAAEIMKARKLSRTSGSVPSSSSSVKNQQKKKERFRTGAVIAG